MTKTVKLILALILLIFAFITGVRYSDAIKGHASWLFETKEEEVELPDLSDENSSENGSTTDENSENLDGVNSNNPSSVNTPQDSAPEEGSKVKE
jgi:hypothetical protein